MLGLSWGEILIIGVVALIVIGPKDLPQMMRTAGRWMRKLRGMAGEFQGAVDQMVRQEEIDDIRKQIAQLRDPELERQLEETMAQARERVRPPAPVETQRWAGAPELTEEDEFLSSDLEDIEFEPVDRETLKSGPSPVEPPNQAAGSHPRPASESADGQPGAAEGSSAKEEAHSVPTGSGGAA